MADTPATFKEKLGEKEGAKKIKHLEAEAWEDFLDMAIGQAGLWAARTSSLTRCLQRSCRQSLISLVHMQAAQASGSAALAIFRVHRTTTAGVTTGCPPFPASSWLATLSAHQATSSPQAHMQRAELQPRLHWHSSLTMLTTSRHQRVC